MAKFKVKVNAKDSVPIQEHEILGDVVQVVSETLVIYSGGAARADTVVFAVPVAKLVSVERISE